MSTVSCRDRLNDQQFLAAMRLALVPGVGPRTRQALLDAFGSPVGVFDAAPSELREVSGVGPKLLKSLVHDAARIDVQAEVELCVEHGIEPLTVDEDEYPRMLGEIHDPPSVLYVRGQLRSQDEMSVAIVGTRHASRYGLAQAERLAGGLARAGMTVVSGLARGIDAAAHRGALAAGGRTLAVLASGLLNIYPPEHEDLAAEICAGGALVAENPPRFEPATGSFPQRNRIISGLSLGVVVVEAAERSGALITARHAMEQNREVFAVPGRVDSRVAGGCHQLIRDGAALVESVDDVLDQLGPLIGPAERADGTVVHHPAELQLNTQEQKVLAAIGSEPTSVDDVVYDSGLPIHRVLSTISVLEMRHLVQRISGSMIARR